MINMMTTARRITSSYKHNKEKMKTTKITTKRIMGSYNQKRGRRKPQSKLQPRGSFVVENTREKG
jgi:dTDP-D-glucose 4,6-dehydratase